jgi:Protein of unknown function (DUF3592)
MSLQLTGNLNKNRWVGVFLLAGGLAMFVGGIWLAREAEAFLETAQTTPGTVIELKRERGVRGMRRDHPIVRFVVLETGREAVFKSKVGLWPSPFEVGEAVEVAYRPDDPREAEINSFWTIWLPPLGLTVFGLLCLGAGLLTLRWAQRS